MRKAELEEQLDSLAADYHQMNKVSQAYKARVESIEEELRQSRSRFMILKFYGYDGGRRRLIDAHTIPVTGATFVVGDDETFECFAEEVK